MAYVCKICNSKINRLKEFRSHVVDVHGLDWSGYLKNHENISPQYCENCGTEFYHLRKRRYCSQHCRTETLSENRPDRKTNDPNYQLVCKTCGKTIRDLNNLGGHAVKHLLSHGLNATPDNYINFYSQELKPEDTRPKLECPLCDWSTVDTTNKSGQFTHHIKKQHGLSITELINRFPEFQELWIRNRIIQHFEFTNDSSSYIECAVCGQKMKIITNSHLKTHGLTKQEYKKKCGNMVSMKTHELLSEQFKFKQPHFFLKFQSKAELELVDYLEQLGIENIKTNVKNLINPWEIDIFLPDYDLAIEFNGLYWHSELQGKHRTYHLDKTEACESKNMQLVHIFEDEWKTKPDIVKSRLKHILGFSDDVTYARNCIVKPIDSKTKSNFLETYHIQGNDKSRVKLGLFHHEKLIAVMTFSVLRQALGFKSAKESSWELSRFATTHKIPGAAGKLFKTFVRQNKPDIVLSYADRRWSKSDTVFYTKLGFKHVSSTSPNYWYLNGYSERLHRFNFTKQRIVKEFNGDPDLTEWENMQLVGWDRIWDSGNLKYKFTS